MASNFQQFFYGFDGLNAEENLSDCPWREDFLHRLQALTKNYGTMWAEIVNSIDRDESTTQRHKEIFFETVESAFDGLLIDATTLYNKHLEIVTKYSEKVENLETNLGVESSYQELADHELSLVEMKDLQMKTIERLEEQAARREQEELQQQARCTNLQNLIEGYKKELERTWDKCRCDGQVRNEFPYLWTTTYNYEIVRIFEEELKRWKRYFEENREILTTMASYEKILREIDELELNTYAADLYKNRNCLLLKEVRKKDLLNVRLRSSEEKLAKQVEYYSKTNKSLYLIDFKSPVDALLQQGSQKKKFLTATIKTPRRSPTVRSTPAGSGKKVAKPCGRRKPGVTPQRALPVVPKFKLNESKKASSGKKMDWKPSRLSIKLSKRQDEDSYTTEYSDFEKEVMEKPRSSQAPKTPQL